MIKKVYKVKMSEILKDIKSADEFCLANKINPTEVIILWEETFNE